MNDETQMSPVAIGLGLVLAWCLFMSPVWFLLELLGALSGASCASGGCP